MFLERNSPAWRLTCFYDFPERIKRKESWDLLRQITTKDTLPWGMYGDFNDILYTLDKKGEHPHPHSLIDGFRLAIEDCSLVELDLTGGEFTWDKNKGKDN